MIFILVCGLGVFFYPRIADFINSQRHSSVVEQYFRDAAAMNEEDFSEIIAAAQAYNEALLTRQQRFMFTEQDREEYMRLLNPFGNNIMGIIVIDSIDVRLPIYHGTSDDVLQVGAGHFEGSSLPVGGSTTHTTITGHRGVPSSLLFTRLDNLIPGDTFELHILNKVLTYRVDQVLVVEPHELEALAFESGMDFATLVTCTPYGVNSHRIMVRGYRTDDEDIRNEQKR